MRAPPGSRRWARSPHSCRRDSGILVRAFMAGTLRVVPVELPCFLGPRRLVVRAVAVGLHLRQAAAADEFRLRADVYHVRSAGGALHESGHVASLWLSAVGYELWAPSSRRSWLKLAARSSQQQSCRR